MRTLLILALLLCAAPALAQTPLDWSDGGAIQMPAGDLDGDAYPAATAMTCDVRVAGVTLRVTSTAGATVLLGASGIPKGSASTASADCEVPAILPGVRGLVATASVSLRPWRAPRAPVLQN